MGVNKVVYNGNTLIDVSQTNVAADKLLKGYSVIGPNGELIEGTFDVDEILEAISSVSDKIDGISGGGASGLIGSDEGVFGLRFKAGQYQYLNQTDNKWYFTEYGIENKPLSSCSIEDIKLYAAMHRQGAIDVRDLWSVGDYAIVTAPAFSYTYAYYNTSSSNYGYKTTTNTQSSGKKYKIILVDNEGSLPVTPYTKENGIAVSTSTCVFWAVPYTSFDVTWYGPVAAAGGVFDNWYAQALGDALFGDELNFATIDTTARYGTGSSASSITGKYLIPTENAVSKLRYFKTPANKILQINGTSYDWRLLDENYYNNSNSSYPLYGSYVDTNGTVNSLAYFFAVYNRSLQYHKHTMLFAI